MFGLIIFLIIILCCTGIINVVPSNTAIIIDRNSHYLKTRRRGVYFLWPLTDKITTKISINHILKHYTNDFETHDGRIVRINFNVEYHTDNIDNTLNALASARRSIDDIMNSSVYWAVNDLGFSDFANKLDALLYEIKPKLLAEAETLEIKIDKFNLVSCVESTNIPGVKPFKPHLNSYSEGPIKLN